ncbi:MAG: hemolysin family protein, partial [Candidatus Nanopelagicales bacterium]|nr:hemolysin family protein [Candidatus Nanopelagicales bacterium]
MSEILVTLAVVFTLSVVGGVFAAAETSLVALREGQISRLSSTRGRRGARLARLASNPNRFLGAVQVGVTLTGFLSAAYGAAQIAPHVSPALQRVGLSETVSDNVAFIAITVVVAYVSLVVGELVPKRIALQRVEGTALALSGVVDWLARISRPFIWLVSVSTNAVVRLLGFDPGAGRTSVTEEELRRMVAAHTDLSDAERAVIDDVFQAADRELIEVMIPRTEVQFLPAGITAFRAARKIMGLPYSRYPVVGASSDEVIGFVHFRDVVNPTATGRAVRLGQLARQIARFPQSKRVLPTLQAMQAQHQHMAIVVDEYGGTAGIVTLEDLVEELVGDITDEYDEPSDDTGTAPDIPEACDVDGLTNLDDLARDTGVTLPTGPYETVAGFVSA